MKAVSEVERDSAFRECLEHDGVTTPGCTIDAMTEEDCSESSALVARVEPKESKMPMRLGSDARNSRADRAEEGVERLQRHVVREIVKACLGETIRCLSRFAGRSHVATAVTPGR